MNVDAIVTGKINLLTGKIEGSVYQTRLGSIDHRNIHATVSANVTVISTETARIMMAEAVTKEEKKSFSQIIHFPKAGSTSTDRGAPPEAEVVNLTIQEVADQMATLLAAKAGHMPARISTLGPPPTNNPPAAVVDLKVVEVNGEKVVIGAGEGAGIKAGDTFEVRRVTIHFRNEQGEDVAVDEIVEQIVIKDVQEQYAIGRPVHSGASLGKTGDKLRKSKTPPVSE